MTLDSLSQTLPAKSLIHSCAIYYIYATVDTALHPEVELLEVVDPIESSDRPLKQA